jgi:hypothetical protein
MIKYLSIICFAVALVISLQSAFAVESKIPGLIAQNSIIIDSLTPLFEAQDCREADPAIKNLSYLLKRQKLSILMALPGVNEYKTHALNYINLSMIALLNAQNGCSSEFIRQSAVNTIKTYIQMASQNLEMYDQVK